MTRPVTVEENVGLVYTIAKACHSYLQDSKLDFDDLVSWGVLGLYDAVDRFDPDRGFQFSTYAGWYIRGYILRGMRAMRKELWYALERGEIIFEIPMDSPGWFGEGGSDALFTTDRREIEEYTIERIRCRQCVERLFAEIPPRDREVVRMLLCTGLSHEKIAEIVGVARSLVTLMWARTIHKGQELFEEEIACC